MILISLVMALLFFYLYRKARVISIKIKQEIHGGNGGPGGAGGNSVHGPAGSGGGGGGGGPSFGLNIGIPQLHEVKQYEIISFIGGILGIIATVLEILNNF